MERVLRRAKKNRNYQILKSETANLRKGDFAVAGYRKYKFGIVACHNGKVYYYSSANARPFLPGVIDDAVDKFLTKQYDLSVEKAFERALNDAANAYGIEWRELK